MKTLRSLVLLRCLLLDGAIPATCNSSYAARSFLRFKRYNASISMRAVMDSDGYLCMAIPPIKGRDPGDYKKFKMCRSCSMEIQNLRTHDDSSGWYKYTSFSIKKEVRF